MPSLEGSATAMVRNSPKVGISWEAAWKALFIRDVPVMSIVSLVIWLYDLSGLSARIAAG
jgi:hypothetical protein